MVRRVNYTAVLNQCINVHCSKKDLFFIIVFQVDGFIFLMKNGIAEQNFLMRLGL